MDLHYSQTEVRRSISLACFTTLWIYTILKQIQLKNRSEVRFTTLWIYTILKLLGVAKWQYNGFTTLWIYTILKRTCNKSGNISVLLPYGFTLFSNMKGTNHHHLKVLLPYGFTLFSNLK